MLWQNSIDTQNRSPHTPFTKKQCLINSINVFYGSWAIKKKGLANELPEDDDLFDVIGSAGINAGFHVVVVGKTDTTADLLNITRVAWTLIYGGVENVAILDGGFNKWKDEKRTVSTVVAKPKAGAYKGKTNKVLGAGTVILTGTRDDRLALGAKMGADQVINVCRENPLERVRELTGGLGPDLVLVTTGMRDSLQQAIEMAPRGTDIVLLAHLDDPVTADIGLAVQKGNSIFTVRGEGRMSVSQALSLMAQGKITPKDLITHNFRLSRIREAIDTFVERRDGAIKVVVHPEEASA